MERLPHATTSYTTLTILLGISPKIRVTDVIQKNSLAVAKSYRTDLYQLQVYFALGTQMTCVTTTPRDVAVAVRLKVPVINAAEDFHLQVISWGRFSLVTCKHHDWRKI